MDDARLLYWSQHFEAEGIVCLTYRNSAVNAAFTGCSTALYAFATEVVLNQILDRRHDNNMKLLVLALFCNSHPALAVASLSR